MLTNHSHQDSMAWTAGHPEPAAGLGSLERFARTARGVAKPPAGELVPAAFALLDGVRGRGSQWNIVYEPGPRRVHFRTRTSARIKSIDLGKLATACGSPVQMLDIDDDQGGDATARLSPYSVEINSRFVERSLRTMGGGRQLPAGAAQLVSAYPATLTCAAR